MKKYPYVVATRCQGGYEDCEDGYRTTTDAINRAKQIAWVKGKEVIIFMPLWKVFPPYNSMGIEEITGGEAGK